MSEPYFSMGLTFLLMLLFGASYISARRHLKKSDTVWSIPFWINFAYLIVLVFFYQQAMFSKLGIETRGINLSTTIMTAGAISHHLALILKKKKEWRILRWTHFQISHLLIYIPMVINSLAILLVVKQNLDSLWHIYVATAWTGSTVYVAGFGLAAGFRNKKLPGVHD